jgi:hypothetical protein
MNNSNNDAGGRSAIINDVKVLDNNEITESSILMNETFQAT